MPAQGRSHDAMAAVPGARDVLVATVEHSRDTRRHRTGQCRRTVRRHHPQCRDRLAEPQASLVDGFEHVFAVNVLAPYLLTALIERLRRLIYSAPDSVAVATLI